MFLNILSEHVVIKCVSKETHVTFCAFSFFVERKHAIHPEETSNNKAEQIITKKIERRSRVDDIFAM